MRVGFFGGAGTVTGSKFLVEERNTRVLVDCGLFQGLKALRLLNWQPTPFDPRSLDAVVLTHAHIDHSGYLPRLVKSGFGGPIYCTPATRELAEILLRDAAALQEEDAEYANRKGFSKHHPALPLFTVDDADTAIRQMVPQRFGHDFAAGSLSARFHDSGHILGSAFVQITGTADQSREERLIFSGDLGRYDAPLHGDPEPLPNCDTVVLESTYGDQQHSDVPIEEQIRGPFEHTLARNGTLLIPAFAVARAQLLLLLLRQLMESGKLRTVPIHLDSPMAIDVTSVYRRYLGSKGLNATHRDLFPRGVQYHRSVEDSKELSGLRGPRIIIAGSGMMTGGRVLHHLRRLLPDEKNLLVLAGYQAAGTRGRSLQEGARSVRIHGLDIPVRARFLEIEGLSAHADSGDLLRWLQSAQVLPANVFLVHGEPPALAALSGRLSAMGMDVHVPRLNDRFESVQGKWRTR
ncbi:MAG: MBL fold metallo-hydrolase [Dehalococcoidia bacterium]|nr:MBL fold metallo-hydrolase [Dehalococcoidia bacterium]